MGSIVTTCSMFGKRRTEKAFQHWHAKLEPFGINLNKSHITAVLETQDSEKNLPANLLTTLQDYLTSIDVDIAHKIATIKETHIRHLREQAKENILLHHGLQHALEIEMRVNLTLCVLGIWQEDTPYERALREIVSCIVFFHDYEQGKGSPDNEKATAIEVSDWLVEALKLPDKHPLIALITFLTHRVIEFGTTMLYSETSPKDLVELLFLFQSENNALDIQNPVTIDSMSNATFVNNTNVIAMLIGLFDKNPGSCLPVVKNQLEGPYATAPQIQSILGAGFLLPELIPYYPHESSEVNQQAFLLMVVPHIAMRVELSKDSEMKSQLFDFVRISRQRYQENSADFIANFGELFRTQNMLEVMDAIFFDKIEAEQKFCRSQLPGLDFIKEQLPRFGYFFELIKRDAPEIDADNLGILKKFYSDIKEEETEKKIHLCQTLLLAVIFQAGELKRLSLGGAFLDEAIEEQPTSFPGG